MCWAILGFIIIHFLLYVHNKNEAIFFLFDLFCKLPPTLGTRQSEGDSRRELPVNVMSLLYPSDLLKFPSVSLLYHFSSEAAFFANYLHYGIMNLISFNLWKVKTQCLNYSARFIPIIQIMCVFKMALR